MTSAADWSYITERSSANLRHERDAVERAFDDNTARAAGVLEQARANAQSLMREIAGQGPEKTLNRGFAMVRDTAGRVLTSAAAEHTEVTIEFRDGRRAAELKGTPK